MTHLFCKSYSARQQPTGKASLYSTFIDAATTLGVIVAHNSPHKFSRGDVPRQLSGYRVRFPTAHVLVDTGGMKEVAWLMTMA